MRCKIRDGPRDVAPRLAVASYALENSFRPQRHRAIVAGLAHRKAPCKSLENKVAEHQRTLWNVPPSEVECHRNRGFFLSMLPRQVVERWVEMFNAADADGLADLYHSDAINHQVTQEPVQGRDAIRAMFQREFATADMTCIVDALYEAGDVVALEWRDPLGLRGCGFFTVRNGRIAFQRGYWDKLAFLKMHGLPIE